VTVTFRHLLINYVRTILGPACVPLALIGPLGACDQSDQLPQPAPASTGASASCGGVPPSAQSGTSGPRPAPASHDTERSADPGRCPEGMQPVPGGRFWVGSKAARGIPDESPRHQTEVSSFCMDRTEVTLSAYQRCVALGACQAASKKKRSCNARLQGRGQHPANCVSWHEADAYCRWRQVRLPTEVEWEYAARGGNEYRRFSWGNEPPDGRSCYKHVGGSCKVGSYPAGAFGLLDMTGNVWEWTDTWFGPYPWPPPDGVNKVYRGGSWSRRFPKWMSTTLRNRYPPRRRGSHLGFRCAVTPRSTKCAFGRTADKLGCLYGVLDLPCDRGRVFNGLRCARPGTPACRAGRVERPGHGCVPEVEVEPEREKLDLSAVTRARSTQSDADCQKYYPGRPHSYRYTGGTHAARNVVSRRAGCANRDVGVGFNSTCCP
jgi:formylglycine-generating enzyme required for sulfatase activity